MDTVSTDAAGHHRQAGDALRRWEKQGLPAGVVRVLERQGFGTVATGQLLAGTEDGDRAGALFEGTSPVTVALPLLSSAVSAPGTAKGHVTEVNALDAGLACAGGAQLLSHPLPEQGDAAGVGLDVGAVRPAETAVSVVGEVLAVRRGRSGGPLATAAGRIGG